MGKIARSGRAPKLEALDCELEEISLAVERVASRHDGFNGNCAAFALALSNVFGGGGNYVIVDSGHYEFADHVFAVLKGHPFDADGMSTHEEARQTWCRNGETLEDFNDTTAEGTYVLRLASEGFGKRLDRVDLEADLRQAVARMRADVTARGPGR